MYIIRSLEWITFPVFDVSSSTKSIFINLCDYAGGMHQALFTKSQHYSSILTKKEMHAVIHGQGKESTLRLFFVSQVVSQFSFRKNTQQTLVHKRDEFVAYDEVRAAFVPFGSFCSLCAKNKGIVFAIWDAIWSLLDSVARNTTRKSILCISQLYF